MKKSITKLVATAAVLLFACCGCSGIRPLPEKRFVSASELLLAREKAVALVGATMIDGTGRDPVHDAVIVFRNGRIVSAGTGNPPDGCRIVDLNGAFVLPGIVNAHVHNVFIERHAELFAESGVTTVRDLHFDRGNLANAIEFRNKARLDPRLCRILSAGSLVTSPGGYKSDCGLTVGSEREADEAVRREIEAGVDYVKIILQEPQSKSETTLSPSLAAFIVKRAHDGNVPVTAHVLTSRDLEIALDAGVDDIAHIPIDVLPDALIDRMAKSGVPLQATLTDWATSAGKERETILTNFRRLADAGVLIALGAEHIHTAHNGGPFIGMPVQEFLMMREAGMTPMKIITASTKNAAKVCGLESELGTLEAGKIADVLVLSRNPLEDLEAFADVRMVVHDGAIIRE